VWLATEKGELVEALCGITHLHRRRSTRLFLEGLSTDELQYIAAYLGARLLEPAPGLSAASRARLAAQIEAYESERRQRGGFGGPKPLGREFVAADIEHKMILLLEYLSLSCLDRGRKSWAVSAGSA
jgi:hypothetical protein